MEKTTQNLEEEKLLSQDALGNQAQISQIESGQISNPTKSTVIAIAKKLEMTFDELIKDTNWTDNKSNSLPNEVAFSPMLLDIEMDDNGVLTIHHKAYPLYNEKGEKNLYCQYSGERLIEKCSECGRSIENENQIFCMGCGNQFFPEPYVPSGLGFLIDDRPTFVDWHACRGAIDEIGGLEKKVQNET